MSNAAANAAASTFAAPGSQHAPLDELARQLWQLWRLGQQPDVAAFLRENPANDDRQLLAVLFVDQNERWHVNETIPFEKYFDVFSDLADKPESLELVLNEIALRTSRGESVCLADYRNRLPQFHAQFDQLAAAASVGTDSEIDLSATTVDHDHANATDRQTLRLLLEAPDPAESVENSSLIPLLQFGLKEPEKGLLDHLKRPEPKAIGPYEIQRTLARGGMGVVYQAIDCRLKRSVALKMILSGPHADPEAFARFRSEAEAVARLQHPSIVQIFEVGEHDGLPFLALEYVDGQNLAQLLNGQAMDPKEAARLVGALAVAVEFAHQKGIIHRDLKPANILITKNGQAKITDFGLAKLREARDTATRPGEVLGTPNYMAPEQAEGHVDHVTPAVDVYSLGAILYELLTGQPPFQGGTPMETLLRVRLHDPIAPSHYQPNLPKNLVTICLKCLRKDRHLRYQSAAELAEDLQRFLDGEPVHARPVTYAERIWMWTRRHPALAIVVSLSAFVFVAANVIITSLWQIAETARSVSQQQTQDLLRTQQNLLQERERARTAGEQRRRVEYQQRLRVSELEYLTNDAEVAVRVLNECPETFRGWEWHYLRRQFNGSVLTWTADSLPLTLMLSEDSQRLTTFRIDGDLRTRSAATGELIKRNRLIRPAGCPTGGFSLAAFSADRKRLAAVCNPSPGETGPQHIIAWDVRSGKALGSFACSDTVIRLNLQSNGNRLAWSEGRWNGTRRHYEAGRVRIADLPGAKIICEAANPQSSFSDLSFSPDGTQLALTGREHPLRIIDATNAETIINIEEKEWTGSALAWSPAGDHIALQRNHEIQLVSPKGQKIGTLSGHRGLIHQIVFSKDGNHLVSASSDETVRLWDVRNVREVKTLVGHLQSVCRIAIGDDERRLVSAGTAGQLKVWDLEKGQDPLCLGADVHRDWVPSLAFHSNQRWLATGCGDSGIHIWDLQSGSHLKRFQPRGSVESIAFQPNGDLLAAALGQGKISIWNLTTGFETVLSGHFGSVLGVAFHPTEKLLLSWGEDGRVRIWDTENGRQVREFRKHAGVVQALALHPNGEHVVSGDSNGMIRIWRLDDAEEMLSFEAHDTRVSCIAFGPDGEWFATANSNRHRSDAETSIKIWKMMAVEPARILTGHRLSIWHLHVSPDGRRIASAGEDWTIKIWDADHGEMLLTLKGHSDDVRCVKFSPDGKLLVSSGDDRCLRIWDASPLEESPGLRALWWKQQN